MANKIKRPPTIWLTQTLLMLFAMLWLSSLLVNIAIMTRGGTDASLVRVIPGVSIITGFVLLLVVAFWGLARRKLYGKWLGLLSLICLWLLVLFIQLRSPSGPFRRYELNSPAQLVGAVISALAISGLFLYLILRLAFSKAVNAFFESKESSATELTPPAV